MLKRTAKSCGSDASTPASSFTEASRPDRARTKPYPETTVTKEPDRRGEHEVSRKTIARGMPGLLRCDRGDYARVLYLISHARLRVHWASGIPCALSSLGETVRTSLGRASRRGLAGFCLLLFENS